MEKRKISAKDFSEDIRAGLTYEYLQTKYNLSDKNLDELFEKLVRAGLVTREQLPTKIEKPVIPSAAPVTSIDAILPDIKAGMSWENIQSKHGLTYEELRKLVLKLRQRGIVDSYGLKRPSILDALFTKQPSTRDQIIRAIVSLVSLGMIGFGIVVFYLLGSQISDKLSHTEPSHTESVSKKAVPRDPCLSLVENAAEARARADALFPSTVDFGWMGWPHAKQIEGTNDYVFSGSVDVKNALGNTITYKIFGKATCTGGSVNILSFSMDR